MTKTIVLSDIDGTLVKGSLVLRHAVFLHESGQMDMGEHASNWNKDQKNESFITALAETYRSKITGKTAKDLHVDDYITDILSRKENFYSVLDDIIEYRKEGAPVVLISGSPTFLVEKFAQYFDFDYSASIYARDELGRFTGDCIGMFSGDAKRKYIDSLDLSDYSKILAYGDTSSDKPLFETAHHGTLVAPTEATISSLAGLFHKIAA